MTVVSPFRRMTSFRLAVLFGVFFVGILTASIAGLLFAVIPGIGERSSLLVTSIVQCIVAFCLPAWVAARFSSDSPFRFLGIKSHCNIRSYLGVVLIYIISLPAMEWLVEWNNSLHLPALLNGLENYLREMEEANASVALKLLDTNGIMPMLATVGVVGLLTGFSEEIFFRGAMQNIFTQSGTRSWIAVWGAAFVFSSLHFQFFGFFPRLIMGAFFGYLLVWTGSLWPAVLAHALNNSVVVVAAWAFGASPEMRITEIGLPHSTLGVDAVASAIATALFLFKFRTYFFFNDNGKEIDRT